MSHSNQEQNSGVAIGTCSPPPPKYFSTMFLSPMSESNAAVITLHDLDVNSVEALVNYAYTVHLEINVRNVQSLLYSSSILQIGDDCLLTVAQIQQPP